MNRFSFVLLAGLFASAAPAPIACADDGWEVLEKVPTWVVRPPAQKEMLRAVDVGLSNLLKLAYDPNRIPRERLNLRWRIEETLRPLLGETAAAPAIAGAKAATVVRKGYYLQRPAQSGGRRSPVGGQVYTAFVLWETPLATVLREIAVPHRDAARAALVAPPSIPSWSKVAEDPAWVAAPPEREGYFVAVATETSNRGDVVRAVADLRSASHVRSQLQRKLRFHLGNRVAFDVADRAVSRGLVLERAWRSDPGSAWMLWAVPVERILEGVAAESRDAVRRALGEPTPPAARVWLEVDSPPPWVKHPPRWPGHRPYVQTVVAAGTEQARKQSIRAAEGELRELLQRLLEPIVGLAAATEAARIGARARTQGAHAIQTARADGTNVVTAWTLWHIPADRVLGVLDARHHAAARKVLLP